MEENSNMINCFRMASLRHCSNEILNINAKNNYNKMLMSFSIINLKLNSVEKTNFSLKW